MFVAAKIRHIILNEHCFIYLDIQFQTPSEELKLKQRLNTFYSQPAAKPIIS
jgi:hypothetical protein